MSEATAAVPSGSPETQELLALGKSIYEGDDSRLPEFQMKLEQRQRDLEAARAAFLKDVEKQGEEYAENFKAYIEEMLRQFDAYSLGLEKMTRYLVDKQAPILGEGALEVAGASYNLQRAQFLYEQQYLATGPSRFPMVNLFNNLGRRFLAGEISTPMWHSTLHSYEQYYSGAIVEIDKSQAKAKAGVSDRRAGLVKVQSALAQLKSLAPGAAESGLEAAMSLLYEGLTEVDSALKTYEQEEFAKGPTPIPHANWIIHAAQGLLTKEFPPSALLGLANEYLERVKKSTVELRRAAKIPTESALLHEETPKLLEAMECMEDALMALREFAENPDKLGEQEVREAIAEFEDAANRLFQANLAVHNFNENQAIQASQGRAFGAVTGQATSFEIMEGDAVPSEGEGPVMTEKMKVLFDACEAFEKGELDVDAYLEQVHISEVTLQEAEEHVRTLELPEIPEDATPEQRQTCQEFLEMGEEALGLLHQGLDECGRALGRLRNAGENELMHEIRPAMQEYFDGAQKLLQLTRVGEMLTNLFNQEVAKKEAAEGVSADGEEAEE